MAITTDSGVTDDRRGLPTKAFSSDSMAGESGSRIKYTWTTDAARVA